MLTPMALGPTRQITVDKVLGAYAPNSYWVLYPRRKNRAKGLEQGWQACCLSFLVDSHKVLI
jgi:hypothetical protein